ncbi:uncharacterized protein LOC118413330 [Branchiostoma floridae]|uniref:Uncharacterized protein LOC118413330 n=1 Tax=Branchiostoma floridae TaxID=7739 RepID=C3Y483_BRAFL|nr:uncharacterized protein LOC118413330 [Branchiostoma floridae]|eukprot:XP_002609099.1 hypothetical protein BRAFLDRAFT_126129 [Branchiostoma floridae]
MATGSKGKRKCLTLSQRIEVIREHEKGGRRSRSLAKDFGVGKTQIANIIKRKREHLDDYANNVPGNQKRRRYPGFQGINDLCWEFYCDTTSRDKPCNGPILQEAGLNFAKDLGVTGFKASNGWLESFKKRHSIITFGKSSGNSRVNRAVVRRRGLMAPCSTDEHVPMDLSNVMNSCKNENSGSQEISASTEPIGSFHPDDVLMGNREQKGRHMTSGHAPPSDISDVTASVASRTLKRPTNTRLATSNQGEEGDIQSVALPALATVKVEIEETEGEEEEDNSGGEIPAGPIKNLSMALKAVNDLRLFCMNEGLGSELFTLYELENRFVSLWMERKTGK